jgi:Flp pilus assembly protein TadD
MADQNPADTFARYGVAMELIKTGQLGIAVEEFKKVIGIDATYSAAYYQGGQVLEKLGRLDEAREFYRTGIATTKDAHARSELQAALDILGD